MRENPYTIQPLIYETKLLPQEQEKLDLVVRVDELCDPKNYNPQKISEKITEIETLKIGNGAWLIKKLRKALG